MRIQKMLLMALLLPCRAAAADLDIPGAVRLALDNNLYLKLARADGEARRADALAAAARLLPQVDLSIAQTRTFRENLTAIGFGSAPGGGAYLIGPFDTFDGRLRVVQSLLDLGAVNASRSKEEESKAAALRVELAAEQVSAAAALAYLEVLRSSASVNSAASGLELAASLRGLSERKHEAGTATGLDVLRAKTREAEESLRVSRARTGLEEALLRLKHLLGIPLRGDAGLAETLSYTPYEPPAADEAVRTALEGRLELRIARLQLTAGDYALKSARSARVPALAVSGDAAFSGAKPDHEAKLVGDMGVSLRLPLFEGGRVAAGVRGAGAAREKAASLLADASAQAEEDTLSALYRLRASADEVDTASMTVTMAAQELEMARNRFAAGAGDNIELVNAQTSLSRARDSLVDALSRSKEAKIRLTLALGRMKDLKF